MPDLAPKLNASPLIAVLMAVLAGAFEVLLDQSRVPSDLAPLPGPTNEVPIETDTPPNTKISGRTLTEWRELMSSVAHDDPTRGDYVPGLIAVLRTPDVPWFTRRQAAVTLGRWGAPAAAAVPVLVELLRTNGRTGDGTTALWAMKGLSQFGPEAANAVPLLSDLVRNPKATDDLRLAAMECLSQIGTANPSGLLPLMQMAQSHQFEEGSSQLRRFAIEALGLFRGGAPAAIPGLIRALDDQDVDVRREAAMAIGRQGPNAEIAQTALFDHFVSDPDPIVREATGVALAQIGPTAIPALIILLQQEDADLSERSAGVLGMMGRKAVSAGPDLKALWSAPGESVRLAALEAYWKVTQRGAILAPVVARELTSRDRNIRRRAYLLLLSLGPAAATARPILEEQLLDDRREVQSTAHKLLMLQNATP